MNLTGRPDTKEADDLTLDLRAAYAPTVPSLARVSFGTKMNRYLLSTALSTALWLALQATAHAQAADSQLSIGAFDPDNAVDPVSSIEGPGIKIGEGSVLHPVVGAETGVVSNVFYRSTDPTPAGLLRLMAQVGTGSLSATRLNPATPDQVTNEGSFKYRVDARVSYDKYFSLGSGPTTGQDSAGDAGGFGIGLLARGLANPMGTFTLGIDENFMRLIRAANFETNANTNRDINTIALTLLIHPATRSLSGSVYLTNTIDVFERSTQSFADRSESRLGVRGMWRWLPMTVFYLDASEGYTTAIGSSTAATQKSNSYPLVLQGGVGTLLTPKITMEAHVGYTNGFYSRPPSYSSVLGGVTLGYRYSQLGRLTLGYLYDHEDSVNANFYADHIIEATLQQRIDPLVFMIQPELHLRHYDGITIVMGPPTRDDTIFAVVAGMHYRFRDTFAATVDYRFTTVQTSYRVTGTGATDPSYVRHEVLAGVRWAM